MKRLFKTLFLLISSVVYCQDLVENISEKYVYTISLENKTFSGEGVDWLIEKADNTKFILFGEQHGIEAVPRFTKTIYKKLNAQAPFHLALEIDAWTTESINEKGVNTFASNYPHAIAFDYDGEIDLIQAVEKESEIWGLDQMVTAIHPYQRLIELTPNENSRRLTQGAFLKAALKMGEYLPQSHFEDFKAIRKAFGKPLLPEAEKILDNLEKSMKIYTSYRAGKRGEISRQVSVEIREEFMKDQFDAYIEKNLGQKVLFKMGGAHVLKGIGPNGVETLGNHVLKTANKNNSGALFIGLFNYNGELQFVKKDVFKGSKAVLFNCETYLKTINDSVFNAFSKETKMLLKGYNGIVLFNDSKYSKKTFIKPYQASFKSGLIQKMSIGVFLLLFCLLSVIPIIIYRFSKSKREYLYRCYGKLITQMFIMTVLVGGLFVCQIYTIISPDSVSVILESSNSIWLFIVLTLLMGYFIYKAMVFINKKAKTKHRVYVILLTIAISSLVAFMYYWNIGGMLSF